MQYKPSEAAKACKVSVNTVRNWCKVYAPFLSPGASGEGGQRTLTGKDLNTLQYIAQLRAENLQQAEIVERLQSTSIGDVETFIPLQTLQHPPMPSNAITEGLQQAPEYFLMVERRLETLEAAKRDDLATIEKLNFRLGIAFAAGLIVAGLFFLIIVLTIWLLGGQ